MADVRISAIVRMGHPDGTSVEYDWDDSGRVSTRRSGPGAGAVEEELATFGGEGEFVTGSEPLRVEQRTDLYGSVVETSVYGDDTTVAHTYDSNVRLRRVEVSGPWGHQTMELWPDGGRSLRWAVGGLRGTRNWDAAGTSRSAFEVAAPAGS